MGNRTVFHDINLEEMITLTGLDEEAILEQEDFEMDKIVAYLQKKG